MTDRTDTTDMTDMTEGVEVSEMIETTGSSAAKVDAGRAGRAFQPGRGDTRPAAGGVDIDPAVRNDWLAVSPAAAWAPGTRQHRRLLGHTVQVARRDDGSFEAWIEIDDTGANPAGRLVGQAREHCGLVFVCLGDQPKALFRLPEFDQPGRRFVYMGAFGIHSGGLRLVENFLDMAHFPFVHAHILGSEEATEVREYRVELDEHQELWARDCKFQQPLASAQSTGGADIDYAYRVVNPFTPMLYKWETPEGSSREAAMSRADVIFLCVQPTDEDRSIAHFATSLFDDENSDARITAFQQTILAQDKPILENHVYKRLPLDPRLEVPARSDASSSAFRRWLRELGLTWGVEPMRAEAPPRLTLRVAAKVAVAQDIVALHLRSASGGPLPAASAGAHLDVHLPNGMIRQYSLCNAAVQANEYVIAVKREHPSRGGSVAVHDGIEVGATVAVGLPKNNFRLAPAVDEAVLIAGGIGITPILAMARDLSARGRTVRLDYFCRGSEQVAFREELTDLLGDRLTLHLGLDPAGTEQALRRVLAAAGPKAHAYACGPAPLMACVERLGAGAGWPAQRLHFEHFRRSTPLATGGTAFEVELARSGRRVTVPADASIVDALRGIDVHLPTSCEQGVCGTCLCTVVDGDPDHRDQYLSAQEKASNQQLLPCVSRARSAVLVLDL